jgi:hypothetical protein
VALISSWREYTILLANMIVSEQHVPTYVFSSLYFLLIYSPWIDLEYTGIWAIALVMTLFGMEAALVAGAVSALLTYAIQSASYPKPIR